MNNAKSKAVSWATEEMYSHHASETDDGDKDSIFLDPKEHKRQTYLQQRYDSLTSLNFWVWICGQI